MNLEVTPQASNWFNQNVGKPENLPNAGIRFKTKIYGSSPINGQFALAIEVSEPDNPIVKTEADGLLFFVEDSDAWFFDGHDLRVDYDATNDEPVYIYIKDGLELQ